MTAICRKLEVNGRGIGLPDLQERVAHCPVRFGIRGASLQNELGRGNDVVLHAGSHGSGRPLARESKPGERHRHVFGR